MKSNRSWDENSQATLTCDFPFADVAANLGEIDPDAKRDDVTELVCEEFRRVYSWIYQPPCKDMDGFICRSIIGAWVFIPEIRSLTLTEIAGRFGKHKQSLGRWVDDFKRQFPEITNHMQHIRNE